MDAVRSSEGQWCKCAVRRIEIVSAFRWGGLPRAAPPGILVGPFMIERPLLVILPLLGLIVGSFIGLVSLRLPLGQPVIMGRSRCQGCGQTLAPWDLVPVLSYLAFGGRCRRCRAPIPIRYPLIELACAVIGLWAALHDASWTGLVTAAFGWWLLLIALVDGENFWLPDGLTLPLLGAGLVAAALLAPETLANRLMGGALGFASLWLIAFAYRRWRGRVGLGDGDPRLFAAIGAWVDWLGLPSVLLWACAAGFSVVGAKLILRKPVSGEDQLPFGVFLAIGAWMTWLYGPLGV